RNSPKLLNAATRFDRGTAQSIFLRVVRYGSQTISGKPSRPYRKSALQFRVLTAAIRGRSSSKPFHFRCSQSRGVAEEDEESSCTGTSTSFQVYLRVTACSRSSCPETNTT